MVTTQIIQRQFYGKTIQQNHHTQFLCVNDILAVGNAYRKSIGQETTTLEKYTKSKKTQEFIHALMQKEQIAQPILTKRGRGGSTWAHPFIALDLLMWLNADFKVEAIKIIYDSVCVFRDKSGDSYKKMAKIVNDTLQLPPAQTSLAIAHIARTIKEKMGVTDWNKASEQQLKARDSIHRDISLLCEAGIHPTKALEIVIKKY